METAEKHIELLYNEVKEYTETSIELYKLNAIDITADVVSSLTSKMLMVLVFSLFTLFVNIGISLVIGDLIGHYYIGFFIVSGFYLIIAMVIYFSSNKLIKIPITNLVIEKLLKSRKKENIEFKLEQEDEL